MKSAICSAIVVCVLPVLVPPVPLVVVPLVPVVLDEPEPCGDLKMLAPGAPEPSERRKRRSSASRMRKALHRSKCECLVRVPCCRLPFPEAKKSTAPPDATAH